MAKVQGGGSNGFCVVDSRGGLIYDLIEEREEAGIICAVINERRGRSDWDAIESEVKRRLKEFKAGALGKETQK